MALPIYPSISNKSLIEQRFRIKLPVEQGFLITQVASGPAAKAGVKAGDVVVSINGQEITKGANFVGLDLKVGDKVSMEIIRNNRKYKVEVIAGPIR